MLPNQVDGIGLDTAIEFEDYPTYTFYVDPISQQVLRMEDGLTAMKQAVQIIFSVERYKWQIFSPNAGIELEGLVGMDFGFITSELKRRIEEALIPDNRILGASDFTFKQTDADVFFCSCTVNTVFGNFQTELELMISA